MLDENSTHFLDNGKITMSDIGLKCSKVCRNELSQHCCLARTQSVREGKVFSFSVHRGVAPHHTWDQTGSTPPPDLEPDRAPLPTPYEILWTDLELVGGTPHWYDIWWTDLGRVGGTPPPPTNQPPTNPPLHNTPQPPPEQCELYGMAVHLWQSRWRSFLLPSSVQPV